MARAYDRVLILEDGHRYPGYGFGSKETRVFELVFNTAMAGYQELISDPGYMDQAVVMTYPLIGNYGITAEDYETRFPTISGLVVSEYNDIPSNFRCTQTLSEIMCDYNIPGIEGLDTRELTRHIRDNGTCRAVIADISMTTEEGQELIASTPVPHDTVSRVSCRKKWHSRIPNHKYNVVAVDCGIKLSIVRILNGLGCNVTVVPYNTTAQEILSMKPNGVIISDGPGDPKDISCVIDMIKELRGKTPVLGIGMGLQLVGLAYGGDVTKLKAGHRGVNYPVKNLQNGKVIITSQDHGYALDAATLEGTGLDVTHVNILDNTVEGVAAPADRLVAVQYRPEGAPGPQDNDLLANFIKTMGEGK
ncbi:MAG: glutamine-hydrolyzing carbamoyl-phosphate synthase small subunit [Clostridia bacterium]|nr:glutamine-hydrolyzing carbamoyl-phosphate synthase small subunit [Clostridia bacterium]